MKEIFQQFIVFVKNQIAEGFFNVRIDNPNDIVDPIKQSTDKISQTLLDIAKDKGVNESFNSDVVDGLSKLEEAINSKQFPEIPKEIIVSNLQGIIEAIKESIQEPPKVEVNFDEKKIVSSLSKIEKKLSVKTIEEIDYTPILSELCDLVENSKTVIDLKNVEILLAEIFSKPSLPIENDRVKVILPDANLFAETGYVAIQRKNLKIPTWENDGVPISPVKGDVGYNIETGVYNIYDGTDWIEYDSNLMHDALTLGVIGSTPNTNGSTITDQVLNLEPASETYGGVVSTAEQSFSGLKKLQGGLQIGSGNDHADFSNKGFPTLAGDAQGKLTLRPNLVQSRTKISSNKPTEVDRGCNVGYSFPIYNSDDEELFFRMRIPARWDGTTDPQFGIMCTITGTESVGNKFKFQLEWQTTHCGGTTIMGTTVSSCVSEQTIITSGGVAHTAYCVFFSLDADDANNPIIAGRMLQGRLRRITASANEVSNEIAVWDWAAMWRTSKVFGVYSVESNVS